MATVYQVNKGINRSIEIKGIKAQYIIYLAVGMVILLLLFAILYVIGIGIYFCAGIIIPAGAGLYMGVQRFSKKYGEHGLLNHSAHRQLPGHITTRSRICFTQLSEEKHEEERKKTGRRASDL
jgi:hypothetical protein